MVFSVYLMAIGLYPDWDRGFKRQLKYYLSDRKGEDWKIISCHIKLDPIVKRVLYNLDTMNDKDNDNIFISDYTLLRIRVESPINMIFKPLPWLEKLATDFIAENINPICAGYFFYFVVNDEINDIDLRIFAICNEDGVVFTEKDTEDDFRYIQRLAGFLFRHLIFHDAETVHPDLMANLLLQIGD